MATSGLIVNVHFMNALFLSFAVRTLIGRLQRKANLGSFVLDGSRGAPEMQPQYTCWRIVLDLLPKLRHIGFSPALAAIWWCRCHFMALSVGPGSLTESVGSS